MRLRRLTELESDKIEAEHADLREQIAELRAILGDEERVMALIKEELGEIRERFADERRTEIAHSEHDVDIEDLIADEEMVVTITKSGYVKSLPLATYRQQKRGGSRRRGRGPEGRRLRRAPLHLLHARLPAVLHEPRQGLPPEGARAAGGVAHARRAARS